MVFNDNEAKQPEEYQKDFTAETTELDRYPNVSEDNLVNSEYFLQMHEDTKNSSDDLATKFGEVEGRPKSSRKDLQVLEEKIAGETHLLL